MPAKPHSANRLFPVFLKLEELDTLLVGGGNVGLEKATAILKNSPGAKLTIVAIEFHPELKKLALFFPGVKLAERSFSESDLTGRDLVIVATRDRELNKIIHRQARERKILVNVADTPDECDLYLGSVVTKGDLKIAISTNGKSPTFARRLREILEETIPDEVNDLLDNLHRIRNKLKGDFTHKVKKLNEITSNLVKK